LGFRWFGAASVDEGLELRRAQIQGRILAQSVTTVATLAIGYAGGIPSSLTGRMEVLVHGRHVSQIGTITMNFIMVNVTGLSVSIGDVATLIGRDGPSVISWND